MANEELSAETLVRGRQWARRFLRLAEESDHAAVVGEVLRRIGRADFRPDATLMAAFELAADRVPSERSAMLVRLAIEGEIGARIDGWSKTLFEAPVEERRRTFEAFRGEADFPHLHDRLDRLEPGLDVVPPPDAAWQDPTVAGEIRELYERSFVADGHERARLRAEVRPRLLEGRRRWVRAARQLGSQFPALAALDPDLHHWVLRGGREITWRQRWVNRAQEPLRWEDAGFNVLALLLAICVAGLGVGVVVVFGPSAPPPPPTRLGLRPWEPPFSDFRFRSGTGSPLPDGPLTEADLRDLTRLGAQFPQASAADLERYFRLLRTRPLARFGDLEDVGPADALRPGNTDGRTQEDEERVEEIRRSAETATDIIMGVPPRRDRP